MMHKIDWDKYLSYERVRQPESKTGHQHEEGDVDMRSEFDSDFGRVVFSSASRRMHDKTQVFPLTNGDSVHTRLTHSLEVMNIAVSLGENLCRHSEFIALYGEKESYELEQKICAILRTAAFVHDIGNPPFGHYGEDTIQRYFDNDEAKEKWLQGLSNDEICDFTQFDGNAEGFRILTKGQYLGDLAGLNLTYAALGAYLKYPNSLSKSKRSIELHKHGVFTTEVGILQQVVDHCNMRRNDGSIKRHPLSFLVEAADTICYTAMDLEDALTLDITTISQLCRWVSIYVGKNVNHELWKPYISEDGQFDLIKVLKPYDHYYSKKKEVNFRVALIKYLVTLATKNFIDNMQQIDEGSYNYELLEDDPLHMAEAIGKFSRERIFSNPMIVRAELTGASVINGILDLVLPSVMKYDGKENKDKRIFSILPETGMKLVHQEAQLYHPEKQSFELRIQELSPIYKLRLVVDWVAGMTDKFALETYQRLSGMRL